MIKLPDEFIDRMRHILKDDFDDFLKSFESPSERSIFINNNKISADEFKNIVDFEALPISYEKNGFYINAEHIGKHPLHHAGAFYVQEPSAMFTVNAFKFNGNERVLDMCAAPGGKSIQIANRIPNGLLVSNEVIASRSEILFSNIERMGLDNVVITNDSPKNIAEAYANCFDVCLVDAPCSGEGMFRKGEEMIKSWNANLPSMCAKRQLEILEQANISLKQGGHLIYSTCTYSVEENEEVIEKFLQNHSYKLIHIKQDNVNFARGLNQPETVRLYPHLVKGEGQFVAVLQKLEDNDSSPAGHLKLNESKIARKFLKDYLKDFDNVFDLKKFAYLVKDRSMIKKGVNYVSIGVRLGYIEKNRFVPHHNLFTALGSEFKQKLNFNFKSEKVASYIKGETFDVDLKDGFGVMLVNGCPLGGFKISKGQFKNLYPKGLRN